MGDETSEIVEGEGYAAGSLEGLGEGPGFRKVRKGLGVTAFGVNAVVMPEGYTSGPHFHDEQEELYFVHQGQVEFRFGADGTEKRLLGPGGMVRVDAHTVRGFRNAGSGEAIYLCVGGKGGYVGRDGRVVDGVDPRPGAGPPGAQGGVAAARADGTKIGDANPANAEAADGAA